jgi:hypothetical protein
VPHRRSRDSSRVCPCSIPDKHHDVSGKLADQPTNGIRPLIELAPPVILFNQNTKMNSRPRQRALVHLPASPSRRHAGASRATAAQCRRALALSQQWAASLACLANVDWAGWLWPSGIVVFILFKMNCLNQIQFNSNLPKSIGSSFECRKLSNQL